MNPGVIQITFPAPDSDQTHWLLYGNVASNKTLMGNDWIAQTNPPILLGKYSIDGELIK